MTHKWKNDCDTVGMKWKKAENENFSQFYDPNITQIHNFKVKNQFQYRDFGISK